MNCQQLCWLDLEMTGLDFQTDLITEVAVVITDLSFKVLAQYSSGVSQDKLKLKQLLDNSQWFNEQPFSYQQQIYDLSANGQDLVTIETDLVKILDDYTTDRLVVLAGNSIHMDRRFLDHYMPNFTSKLHYRMLDVTSYKIYLESMYKFSFNKKQGHRALDDVYESIEEFKFYLKKMGLSWT